jgi:hypothetical protein
VHRDLKPENILLFKDTPKVADLGIAHIAPGFIDWSQLTVSEEHLMNRDYYAPEQRHGDATKVDHRADIYALGCILYEIVSGISPTRPNLPPLKEFHRDLAPLDAILSRMIAHRPEDRYGSIDAAFDDLVWALVHTRIPTSGPSTDEDEKKELIKLLTSANAANQSRAIEPAMRLGTKAMAVLHEHVGHRRLDVAMASYRLLGEIGDESSLPYLIAGLYPRRTGKRPQFPTGEYAAAAMRNYPATVRLRALERISDVVRPEDIAKVIDDLEPSVSYDRLLGLYRGKKFYPDWDEHAGLSLLVRVDQDRTWPIVHDLLSGGRNVYSWMIFRDIYPLVNTQRQQMIIEHYLSDPEALSSWELPRMLEAAIQGAFSKDYLVAVLDRIGELAEVAFKRYAELEKFKKRLRRARSQVLGAPSP